MSMPHLTPTQTSRWFNANQRNRATMVPIEDYQILENPFRIAEIDLGDTSDPPVSVGVIERGLLPDDTIAARHPVPSPSAVGSPNDARRIRAALVAVLRTATEEG